MQRRSSSVANRDFVPTPIPKKAQCLFRRVATANRQLACQLRSITLTLFPAMFKTSRFLSLKANADGPSSRSGGFGVKVPILLPLKSKISTVFMLALDV